MKNYKYMEEGYLEDEVCNRNGCKGIITLKDIEGSCSCHINPPCSYCETSKEYCPDCGWDAEEERWELYEKTASAIKPRKVETYQETQKRLEERYNKDDGKLYKVVRYFDSIKEGLEGSNMKLGDACRLLDKLNNKERYYVSYSIREQND